MAFSEYMNFNSLVSYVWIFTGYCNKEETSSDVIFFMLDHKNESKCQNTLFLVNIQTWINFYFKLGSSLACTRITDYGPPERKSPPLNRHKCTPTPKSLDTAKAYFVCHIGPKFQISLIYAFIGCP